MPHYHRQSRILTLTLALATYMSSVAANDHPGQMVFVLGERVQLLDLNSRRISTVPNVKIRGPVPMTSTGDETVIGSLSGLFELNTATGATRRLGPGFRPTYHPGQSTIYYVRGIGPQKKQNLFVSDPKNLAATEEKVFDGEYPSGLSVIPISAKEVVFPTPSKRGVLRYNAATEKLSTLFQDGCFPWVWRTTTQQLLCSGPDSAFFLTSLDGAHRERIPELKKIQPILYVPQLDALAYTRPASGYVLPERRDLYLFYFRHRQSEIVMEDVPITYGYAALIEEQNKK